MTTRAFLLIHGMSCTGEVWSNFKAYYEERGIRVYTPTIRPQERVATNPPKTIAALRFADYVDDMERELDRIEAETGGPVTVIGHSMGGLIAQALAERNRPNAAVFITPSPPAGCYDAKTKWFWRAFKALRALRVVPEALPPKRSSFDRIAFNRLPEAHRADEHAKAVHDSANAFAGLCEYSIDESRIKIPVLTVAATHDQLVPAPLVRTIGEKYAKIGGTFKEYADHAHWLYAEPGWEIPAAEILSWIEANTSVAADRPLEVATAPA
jgi:pimeloyl-ACP methyl ester carboxylesterase